MDFRDLILMRLVRLLLKLILEMLILYHLILVKEASVLDVKRSLRLLPMANNWIKKTVYIILEDFIPFRIVIHVVKSWRIALAVRWIASTPKHRTIRICVDLWVRDQEGVAAQLERFMRLIVRCAIQPRDLSLFGLPSWIRLERSGMKPWSNQLIKLLITTPGSVV